MNLNDLKLQLEEKLRKNVTSKIFLDRMRMPDEDVRQTVAYNDSRYIPFYYWLGELVKPCSFIEIGFRFGLFSGNFVKSCKTVQNILVFQEKTEEYYSPRLGRANIKDNFKGNLIIYIGDIQDEEFDLMLSRSEWELAIINEETNYDLHKNYLDVIWSKLKYDGLIVMDYVRRHRPAQEAFDDFCRSKNRTPVYVETRYGVGMVKK